MLRYLRGFLVALLVYVAGDASAASRVAVVPLTGAIGPASANFVGQALARASEEGAELIVLRLDTPGGLDRSMRQIIQDILASPVPVAVFVAPSGARAASAGTYILYASHIAAMAPGTNLGAATPVNLAAPDSMPSARPKGADDTGKDTRDKSAAQPSGDEHTAMDRKQVNDAAAYLRSLAQLRGRNAEWAERAVREAVSLSATEALAQKVIDLTATDVPDLLARLDGRVVTTAAGARTLATAGASVTIIEPDWRTRFLAVVTDPSVALMLLMAGVYGLLFEFWSPGMALPGVLGAICLVLGLFALQMLPVNYAGLGLVLLGLTFMATEVFLPAYGSLGVGGLIAFIIGAVMLIDTDQPGFAIPFGLIVALGVLTLLFVIFVGAFALKARRRPLVSGDNELVGTIGIVLDDGDRQGWATVRGEQWQVTSTAPLKRGQQVRVTARNDLMLSVTPIAEPGGS